MKTLIVCGCVVLGSIQLFAAPPSSVEKVQFQGEKVLVLPGGKILEAPHKVTLPFNIVVLTNGTYTVGAGRERQLKKDEILSSDGMLSKPDGSIIPVVDHVTMNRGKVIVFKDGVATELQDLLVLSDGTGVTPEGQITLPGAVPRRLLDGEIFQPSGVSLPARDTISMRNGRVIVQKDGSQLTVEPGRSITMNDGTKVMGDGSIVKFNGDQARVSEGETYTLEGVVRRPR